MDRFITYKHREYDENVITVIDTFTGEARDWGDFSNIGPHIQKWKQEQLKKVKMFTGQLPSNYCQICLGSRLIRYAK